MQFDSCKMQTDATGSRLRLIESHSRQALLCRCDENIATKGVTIAMNRCVAMLLFQLAVCIVLFDASAAAGAQNAGEADKLAPNERLFDRRPFDQLVLKERGKVVEVMTLALPQRPLASMPAEGSLRVRLPDRPTEEFEVAWSSIARVLTFEELLLNEAKRLTAAGKFDEAYDYYARLNAEYPSLPGLKDSLSDYLRRNALALYQAKQYDRALALLLSLYQRDPKFNGLAAAVETVAGQVIQGHLRDNDYAAARGVLELWQSRFRGLADVAAAEWQRRFETAATREVESAANLIQQRNYVAARAAAAKATAIWPKLPAAANINAQIDREFPFVNVGVLETSPREPTYRIDCWPAIRSSRLTQRLLAEEVGFGTEGGIYRSPYGQFELDDSGRSLTLVLDPSLVAAGPNSAMSADNLARYLLAAARPEHPWYRADLANLLDGVSIGPGSVRLNFARPYVRPEALLKLPPAVNTSPFSIMDYGQSQVVFARPETTAAEVTGMRAVVEQTFASDEAALNAIASGAIDVLDRVPPWQVERLRGVEGIRVESYRLPTVHVLIPNHDRPLLAKREFRRALCFGIDRQRIVSNVLLGGQSIGGYEVVSGPFPAGTSLSDPVRYGYNNRIQPRAYEPRLAAILSTIAWAGVNNPTGNKEDAPAEIPELPELTLAHPIDPVARVACQSIAMQLARAGIRLKLVEFSADELLSGAVDYDLRYAELAVWEPLTDAREILGPGGLAGDIKSPYLQKALRNLDEAANWNEVRTRLADVHEIAHHELPVIPLWQTVNFFAYRESLRGIGETPVRLYQDIESWSNATPANVASSPLRQP